MMVAVCAVTLGGVYVGSAVVARHRAQAAADLAALAAASMLVAGGDAACAQAAMVSRAMGGRQVGCTVDRLDVVVAVEVAVTKWGSARAAARAGPIDTTR
jgi:secretion/DNA translocation related TadE-like protein